MIPAKIEIDSSLTHASAKDRGYEWCMDIAYDELGLDETDKKYLDSIGTNYLFGMPFNTDTSMLEYLDKKYLVGIYEPIPIGYQNKHTIVVDDTLTPENAPERGYLWWTDHLYDPSMVFDNEEDELLWNNSFIELIQDGGKLGQPANPKVRVDAVGIYVPLK